MSTGLWMLMFQCFWPLYFQSCHLIMPLPLLLLYVVAMSMYKWQFAATQCCQMPACFRVMVLQNGEIVEFDSLANLLASSSSQFYSMAKDAGLLWYLVLCMVIVWRLRGNIVRTALCWIVWHNVHSQQHTYMSSSYRSNRLGLSHWDSYAVRRRGCLELYYCNMLDWFWWDSSLISITNWFPSVLWHCWFGHLACKYCPRNDL